MSAASPEMISGPPQPPLIVVVGAVDLAKELRRHDMRVSTFKRMSSVLNPTRQQETRLILLGPSVLNEFDIESTIPKLRDVWPLVDVVLWAPRATGALVRSALGAGARDVILRSSTERVAKDVRSIIDAQQLLPHAARLDYQSEQPASFEGMLSRSRAMWDLFDTASQVAMSEATVLILGETGTGKELFARAIHSRSHREGRFVALNCGAVNENLIDAELFGYEKGAFTGAARDKEGLFRHANAGTLMLDEVGNIPLTAQYRLLRVLQEGTVRPVGGHGEEPVDVRVIAATSNALEDDVQRGKFREDLFYRLDVLRLEIPPLRERKNDIIFLFGHFAKRIGKQYNINRPDVSDAFLDALSEYDWPGNVRQLENFTERLVLTHHDQRVDADDFDELIPFRGKRESPDPKESERAPTTTIDTSRSLSDNLEPIIQETERRYLEACLRETGGRMVKAAELAGISRRTLLRKLDQYGIDKRVFKAEGVEDDSE